MTVHEVGEGKKSDEAALVSVPHPEQPLTSHAYLNLYDGLLEEKDIDASYILHSTEMTEEQRSIYASFLDQVNNNNNKLDALPPDDWTCLRFLQADKYNTDQALERLVQNQVWLKEWNIPQILAQPPAQLTSYRKLRARAYMGRTGNGMPIFVERLGDFMNAISSSKGKELSEKEYLECFLFEMGELLAKLRESYPLAKKGSNNDKKATWRATWIMDCKNVTLYRAMKATHILKVLDAITEPNFPEIAGPIYIINCPSIVTGVWKIIRAFLDPSIVAKIQIHSNVPKDILLKGMDIDESVLFEEYGGTNSSPFPQAEYS